MNSDTLRRLWESVRNNEPDTYGALVTVVELASLRLRDLAGEDPPLLPPKEERETLWETGRLAYEVSFALIKRVESAWGITEHSDSRTAADLIARLADTARILPWPEYAPHSLGAIRAQALAESKHDTIEGYDNAWAFHREARRRYGDYEESLIGAHKDYDIALHETMIQLGLSEAGTACRTAERVICRWAEGVDGESEGFDDVGDEESWITRLSEQLSQGVAFGSTSLSQVGKIDREHGLVTHVDHKRITQVTAYRNPGVMTARALLLLIPLYTEMSRLGHRPPLDYETWEDAQDGLRQRFAETFAQIGTEVSTNPPFSDDHLRSLVQLRLNYAWLAPGRSLIAVGPIDEIPCLAINPLDIHAITELSKWLTQQGDDGNAIASATMPSYIHAVQHIWSNHGDSGLTYAGWRRNNIDLDRYRNVSGREERVRKVLADHDADSAAPNTTADHHIS